MCFKTRPNKTKIQNEISKSLRHYFFYPQFKEC